MHKLLNSLQEKFSRSFEKKKDTVTADNSGLPIGAIRFESEKLEEIFDWAIEKMQKHKCLCVNQLVVSGPHAITGITLHLSSTENPLFNNQVNPIVDNEVWMQGIAIDIGFDKVILFIHPITIAKNEDQKIGIAYRIGNIPDSVMEKKIQKIFCHLAKPFEEEFKKTLGKEIVL